MTRLSQSTERMHRLVQGSFFFEMVTSRMKQLSRSYDDSFFRFRNACWQPCAVCLNNSGYIKLPPMFHSEWTGSGLHNQSFVPARRMISLDTSRVQSGFPCINFEVNGMGNKSNWRVLRASVGRNGETHEIAKVVHSHDVRPR
jgi:hypothetical protein